MSKLADQLTAIGIHNLHGLVSKGHPCVARFVSDGWLPSCWMLCVIQGKMFDFSDNGINWRAAVSAPLARCKELFPDLEMVKGPWPNTFVPKVDLEAAMKKLKEQK